MDKLFLSLVRKFDFLLQRAGVNTDQLHEILRVKLMMDNRRPRSLFAKRASTNTKVGNPWFSSLIYAIIGFAFGMLIFIGKMPLSGHAFFFTMFTIFMCFTLVTDFTTVLIDTRDQFILLPRPVDDRTVSVSRILHIAIYVLRLALIMGIPAIIMVGFADKNYFSPIIMLVEIIEATFLSILIVNLIYLAMMRTVNPQRFKDLVSYFQIAFSTLIFGAYYLVPRLVNLKELTSMDLLSHSWAYLLPPVWISALNEVLIHPARFNFITALLALTGLLAPILGMWFVIRVLAPGFNKKLAVLATSESNESVATKVITVEKQNFRDKVSNIVAPDPLENAGFRITWKLAARTREFKMKAYPSFAFVPIMFIYIALSGGGKGTSVGEKMASIQNGSGYVFLIYMSTVVLMSLLTNITMSDKFKAAWVYYALPIDKPGKILAGMYKAIVTLYYLPFCVILSVAMAFIWGPQVINDVILAFFICLIHGIIVTLFAVKGMPFSKPVLVKQGGGRAVSSLAAMGLVGLLGYGHYFLMKYETLIWAMIIPIAAIAWIMLNQYKKTTWNDLESFEEAENIEKPKK